MEANKLLGDSLAEFNDKFGLVVKRFHSELSTLGEVIQSIELKKEPFVENLLMFSEAVLAARSKDPALMDLPVPPYDLWLPFKAESIPEWDPKALAEANRLFNEKIQALAKDWRMTEPTETIRHLDPELVGLRDQIMRLPGLCNERCSGRSLFKPPSQSAWNKLITRLIPTYVASEIEFDELVNTLYVTLDETLRTDVRQWKSDPVPGPLVKIKELLHKGDFHHLGTLRNVMAHQRDPSEAAPIYERLIGKRFIDSGDVASWRRLQKALLEMLVEELEKVRKYLEQTPEDASYSAAAGR